MGSDAEFSSAPGTADLATQESAEDAVTPDEAVDDAAEDAELPDWWHRDHPIFTALVGFYTGVVTILVVPAVWGAVLRALVGLEEAERLFGWVLLVFLVPLVLAAVHRTRRVGLYMLAGMALTAVVVVGVAAAVLWVLMR